MGGAVASIVLRALSNSREQLKRNTSIANGGASCPRDTKGRLLPPSYKTIEKTEIIKDKSGNIIETKTTYFKEIM